MNKCDLASLGFGWGRGRSPRAEPAPSGGRRAGGSLHFRSSRFHWALAFSPPDLPVPQVCERRDPDPSRMQMPQGNPLLLSHTLQELLARDTVQVELIPEKKGLFLKHVEYEVSSQVLGALSGRGPGLGQQWYEGRRAGGRQTVSVPGSKVGPRTGWWGATLPSRLSTVCASLRLALLSPTLGAARPLQPCALGRCCPGSSHRWSAECKPRRRASQGWFRNIGISPRIGMWIP